MKLAYKTVGNGIARAILSCLPLMLVNGVVGANECPPTIHNCDYYKQCIEAGAGVEHCAKLHSKERHKRVQEQWDQFYGSTPAEREKMIKEVQGQNKD